MHVYYTQLIKMLSENRKALAILIDPEKFIPTKSESFLKSIPKDTTHLFVGGSTVPKDQTEATVTALKNYTTLPIFIFPGDYTQITETADGLLFLSLLSGRNPEYLIGQQIKGASKLKDSALEIIPTGYILIEGGNDSAVAKVSGTNPMPQNAIEAIVNTALAGQLLGAKLIYLEAGSGAKRYVSPAIVSEVKKTLRIPLIVGGGIKTEAQKQEIYNAGADMIVMGTAFEQ
ncbi:geranylgeranylglyceryl/heptaprenylglyceryl phosphate synthase [Jejudonia soesokkakensis]|uniref:Geranylgeranylglyceryl phosphate synthase n=1 Tax=Jejudonia soesokkakensis TaxID=1323432 RepID=A0ABW2MNF0_9FLAO